MFIVYILYSETTQKYYTGQTQDIENRMLEHNSGETTSIKSFLKHTLLNQHIFIPFASFTTISN